MTLKGTVYAKVILWVYYIINYVDSKIFAQKLQVKSTLTPILCGGNYTDAIVKWNQTEHFFQFLGNNISATIAILTG